ncbi:ABC transporter ATP-binding protein [uncultured Acetatifactor sp.]|uniref:ABC transporter ATP-binding protein n=1 Tax=uncultured Acetatifactor sp. TaxID=1671927 RepID=UPI0026326A95|nr:ABC transporter ATP-binding protein [uncultured Acetatifactor sp.]MCI8695308.1 ABC transporter ATP-binding protein [Lachnospiraceae bacterium]
MRFIFSYLKKYRGMIAAAMTIKSIAALGELMLPYVLEHMVDDVVPRQSRALIFGWGAVMIALAVFVRQTNVKANRMSTKVAKESIYEIRRDLFWKSLGLSGNQVDEFGLPSLNSRMTSDSYNVQNFIRSFQAMGVRAPILLIGGIAITLTMDVGLASVLCILAPIMIGLVVFVSWKGIPLYEKVQQCVDDIVRIMRENITGIRVVKALSKEDYEMRRFGEANEQMAGKDIRAGIVMALPGPLMTFVLNVGLTIVVVVGAVRVDGGLTRPGVILAFLTYFNMISMGVMGLNRVFMMMSKANASAARIAAVVHAEDELTPLPEAEAAVTEREDYIVFDHVGFHYGRDSAGAEHFPGQAVGRFDGQGRQKSLDDIDFSMKKGGTLGIIGATGCGKTTIINLLMRFYDADEGAVFIDGKDVRTYDKDALHRMFGVVFQNDVIFADSLKENIAFGRDVSPEQMDAAAADARARDFIREYEDTYEHRAVVRGANLSGGQRQRVLIARALAAAPDILILDDSSSALDYKTDAALRKAIREHHADTTTIIVAQRISSIMSLDDIIVLEEGKIIGHGTHDQLLEGCPMYQEIYRVQMGA